MSSGHRLDGHYRSVSVVPGSGRLDGPKENKRPIDPSRTAAALPHRRRAVSNVWLEIRLFTSAAIVVSQPKLAFLQLQSALTIAPLPMTSV